MTDEGFGAGYSHEHYGFAGHDSASGPVRPTRADARRGGRAAARTSMIAKAPRRRRAAVAGALVAFVLAAGASGYGVGSALAAGPDRPAGPAATSAPRHH